LHSWGWRIAFLAGSVIIIVARFSTPLMVETPFHQKLTENKLIEKSPIKILFKQEKLAILQCIGITAIHAVLTIFILLFMPTFLQHYGMGHKEALNVNIITIMVFSTILPLFGWFGNKASLRTMMVFACILLILFAVPLLHMIANHNILIRTIGILALTIINCMISAAIPPIIVGLFPTNIRYCGVSFSYNLCIAIFAGIAPIVIAILGHKLNSLISATTIIMIFAAFITLISTIFPMPKHMPIAKKRFSWFNQQRT
jgi:MHS family proline/betaine transporter-like MFS transporter